MNEETLLLARSRETERKTDWEEERCYREGRMSATECMVKRAFDVVASLFGLLVTSPAFLVIFFLVRREDGGPAIFRQERIGYGGKPFMLYKFRSMRVSSEADGKPALCKKDDERLTRIGGFLRRHHLDELPQLWNVLKGEMSFVGPRPERKYFVDRIKAVDPRYEQLYQIRPGLFSLATLYNGYTDTLEKMLERLRMDLQYLRQRSLWLDLKIIVLTVLSILSGKEF